jgi:hypothetical protein
MEVKMVDTKIRNSKLILNKDPFKEFLLKKELDRYNREKVTFLYTALNFNNVSEIPFVKNEKNIDDLLHLYKFSYVKEYQHRDITEYTLKVDGDAFMLQKGNNYYYCAPFTLEMPVQFSKMGVSLKDRPSLPDQGYQHPFVFTDGNICYNEGSTKNNFDWKQLGISFGEYKNFQDRKKEGSYINRALEKAFEVLHTGLERDGTLPANPPFLNKPVARSSLEAFVYALKYNVPNFGFHDTNPYILDK